MEVALNLVIGEQDDDPEDLVPLVETEPVETPFKKVCAN